MFGSSWARWKRKHADDLVSNELTGTEFFDNNLDRVRTALDKLGKKRKFDVLFFSRRPEYFDISEMNSVSSGLIKSLTFCTSEEELRALDRKYDIAIACAHLKKDHLSQQVMRSKGLASLIVSWTWDNHHEYFQNLCNICLSDIVLPAHDFCADKLKSPFYLLGRSFPLCTGQWSREHSKRLLSSVMDDSRSDSLHGGYIMWDGSDRNDQLLALKNEIPENKINLIDRYQRNTYFDLSAEDRFRDWSSYKVSIQISFAEDLSLRVFDALLTGQIPIVPESCRDLDRVVSREIQEKLPILRIKEVSVPAVTAAWKLGISYFDSMGADGIRRRHEFALNNHHITLRLQQIVKYIFELKSDLNVELRKNDDGIGLVERK
jgi:hypothetical protein